MDQSDPPPVERLLRIGLEQRRLGNRAAALEAFHEAANLEPARLGIRVELACELTALDRLEEAESHLLSVLSVEPNDAGALVELAHVLRRRGDLPRALQRFASASAAAPDNVPIRLELARTRRALGQIAAADAELIDLLKLDPGNGAAAIERGHLRRQSGDDIGALAAFAAGNVANPQNADLQLELAQELMSLDRLDDAEAVLRAVIALGAKKAAALLLQARLSRRRGDAGKALEALDEAARPDVTSDAPEELPLEIARELRLLGANESARRLVRRCGSSAAASMALGELCRETGDHEGAAAAFRDASTHEAFRAVALVELAREYWSLGSPHAAVQAVDLARKQEPTHLGAMLLLTEHALQSGLPETAVRRAVATIDAHPAQLAPYLVGARAAVRLRLTAALSLLDEAQSRLGAQAEIVATRIHVLRVRGRNDAAREAVSQARSLISCHVGLWIEAISFAVADGDFESAEQWLAARPDDLARTRAAEFALRARLAYRRRDYEAASSFYERAVAESGGESDWLAGLAECRLLLADVRGAQAALNASIHADAARRIVNGESLNASQHHLAQLQEELVLDEPSLGRLKEVSRLEPASQIEPLRLLLRDAPGNTGPALLLLSAMRRAGRFAEPQRGSSSPNGAQIPRRIVQYWHERTPPPDVLELMDTWRVLNPDHEHIVLDDHGAQDFIAAHASSEALRAYRRASEIAQRVDILRLVVLCAHGGFFVDADDYCLQPLSGVVPQFASLFAYQEPLANIGANFIGANRGHPVIVRALALATEALIRGDRDIPWLSTGTGLITRAFGQELLQPSADVWLSRAVIVEAYEIHRAIAMHMPLKYKMRPAQTSTPIVSAGVNA